MIRIENLRKEFEQGSVALKDLNLVFEEGTFVALLGPSGCGKTTTLNCIAGLLEPTAGTVWFDDKDVTNLPPRSRNIGMVFQSYSLYPHMSVLDNIAFPLKQKGIKKEERYKRARSAADKLQIEHLLARKPAQLSGGQQQRVAMARALVKEPDVLLMDEPMSNLDARLKIEIRDVIKRLQQELGLTSVIVTHDQEEAMAIADKIAILDNGEIQQFDTPEELYNKPANLFVAHFMGNPPMNFIDAQLVQMDEQICLSGTGFCFPVPGALATAAAAYIGKAVKIGVRSHQMAVGTQPTTTGMTMKLQIVENLGKELMLSGMVGESFVRVTVSEFTTQMVDSYRAIRTGEDNSIYLELNDSFNIFEAAGGNNIAVKQVV